MPTNCRTRVYAIAEDLTRDGIPSPSAHDRARNRHREGIAWAKSAIRTILANPRYTGHQVWNKQRKQETLLDVEDVALGYQTRMRWNSTDQWVWSAEIVHTPLISLDDFHRAQAIAASGTRIKGPKDRPSKTYEYLLRGLVHCHLCGRKMISQRSHQTTYYRCRYPDEYALANKVAHHRNITVRESDVVPALDAWLARHFALSRREATIDRLWQAQNAAIPAQPPAEETAAVIKDCDRKLVRYRTLIDSGAADLATVAQWIRETEARRTTAQAEANRARTAQRAQRLTRDRIAGSV